MRIPRSRLHHTLAAIVLGLAALSCSDKTVNAPLRGLIAGGASRSEAPAATLTWLPPLGTGSPNAATFDPTGASRVEVCAWSGSACTAAPVATFTATPTPGAGTLTVNSAVGRYEATLSLVTAKFAIRKTYRIRVFQGATEIGGISFDAVIGRWALTRTDGTVPPLLAASSLAIQFHVALPPLAPVTINEIESSGGIPDDWVELYNAGTATVDLSGFVFKDNNDSHIFTIPSGTTIAAGGLLVFDTGGGANQFNFGLGSSDAARLFDTHGRLVDSYSWTQHATTTYGRCPNGTGPFVTTTSSTKGLPNDCSNPVKINEVESDDGSNPDWIELHNPGAATVDLSGFVLKDNDNTHAYTIPSGTTIAAGGFMAFDALGFGLGSSDQARFFDPQGNLLDSYTWTSYAATTYGRCPDGSGPFITTGHPTKGAANDCTSPVPVRINEVESNGGVPDDWIELYNISGAAVDLSGFELRDNDDTHHFFIPSGTSIAAHAFLVFDTGKGANQFDFGLGSADAARLFTPTGTLVDSYSWTAHAATTYGRCPDGTGDFATTVASTKGTANSCPASGPTAADWPGGPDVVTADTAGTFSSNLSGLIYEIGTGGAPDVLWGARNGPGSVYRMIFNGTAWIPDPSDEWKNGKGLLYTGGTGEPDSEDITFTTGSAAGVFIASERDNTNSGVSRPSVLRYNVSDPGPKLTATNEWNLVTDLPGLPPNSGIEGITWMPDSYVVSKGFFDVSKNHAYSPSDYPSHVGGGVFFVGIEGNGNVYAYVLNSDNTFQQLQSISTGFPAGVMALQFDRDLGDLWATCDDTCGGLSDLFAIDTAPGANQGRLTLTHIFNRPSGMPNVNNEGFAFAPLSLCAGGFRPVFWSDDNNDNNHSLRRGTLACPVSP